MDGILRSRRFPTVVLWLLCAAPTASTVEAQQQFDCWPIARGETVPRLARQLTGDADGAYTMENTAVASLELTVR